jgi:hypothetical protein
VRIQPVDGIAERNDDPFQECETALFDGGLRNGLDLSWIPVTASGLALVVFDVSGKAFLCLGFITGVGVF